MKPLILAVLMVLGLAAPAFAEPTTITVRALARDAKFIGTGMGGVKVRLLNADSEEVLAEGVTSGGTGDTKRLVVEPRARGAKLSGEGDAAFTATIDLEEPTLIRLEATGPGGNKTVITSTAWVLPGQPVVGDGWVVEFPGLVVTPTLAKAGDGRMTITAKVVLMCGCPVTPGGLWDADPFKVTLVMEDVEGPPKVFAMAYAGQDSTFSVTVDKPKGWSGTYWVTAFDARTGNVGVVREVDFGRR